MRCYTTQETEAWLNGRERELPTRANNKQSLTLWYPPSPAELDFLWIARELSYRVPVLLWITEWGIWPGNENWHLYDRLRQSYGERRQLHEAPGHLLMN